jgi:hypothetical protein
MSEVTRRAVELAHCILAHEAAHTVAGQQDQALQTAVQKLRARLTPVISVAGFDALLGRAVRLAAREHAGRLTLADSAVLAHFLHLLAVFLGEHLTVRLLAQHWQCVSEPAAPSSRQVHP